MKVLKQLLFAAAVMICFSIAASAQQKPDDKKPKDPNRPQIIVVPKNDDKNKPKENDKPKEDKKKPESAYLKSSEENEMELV